MSTTDVAAATEAALTPTTFDFALAVQDREYPEITVPVYLNERKAQQLVDVTDRMLELDQRVSRLSTEAPVELAQRLAALQDEHDALVEELKAEEYIILVRGIAPEDSQTIEDETYEVFPREFNETQHPITGQVVRTEIESEERDELFATRLRQAHIVSVTAPNGAVDTDFKGEANIEKMRLTFSRLPIVARVKLDAAINASKVSVDYYRELADEVFSPRP